MGSTRLKFHSFENVACLDNDINSRSSLEPSHTYISWTVANCSV